MSCRKFLAFFDFDFRIFFSLLIRFRSPLSSFKLLLISATTLSYALLFSSSNSSPSLGVPDFLARSSLIFLTDAFHMELATSLTARFVWLYSGSLLCLDRSICTKDIAWGWFPRTRWQLLLTFRIRLILSSIELIIYLQCICSMQISL